ncbi:hypothetical protein DFH06DRAFT_1319025 [Mycena polygramma]|nr:hypothetical protein DFH06DRAFT_1319025 [Mycena polygramma]
MAQVCINCGAFPSAPPVFDPPPPKPAPELAHLLRSNGLPLDSEIPSIPGVITEGQAEIVHWDARINALEAQIQSWRTTLAHLVERREEVAEHVRRHQSVISPVRRVPRELICEILVMAVPSSSLGEVRGVSLGRPPDPKTSWYLGLVSRSWRDCALSCPALWTTITISSSSAPSNGYLVMIEEQLRRSATAALELYWPNPPTEVDPRLLSLVLPSCTRWRTLHLHDWALGLEDPVLDWLKPVRDHLNQLNLLTIVTSRHLRIPDVFMTAPNLHRVVLIEERFSSGSPAPSSIEIPWGKITHYRGTYSLARHTELLQVAPNVLECILHYPYADSTPPVEDTAMTTLPNLRRLWSWWPPSSESYFPFTAPSLEELTIYPSLIFLPFIQRSSSTLNKLALTFGSTHFSQLIPILRAVPNLGSLVIHCNNWQESVREPEEVALFNAMLLVGAPSDLCPKLASFVYGYTDWRSLPSIDAFFAQARSRFRQDPTRSSPLARLRVCYLSPHGPWHSPPNPILSIRTKELQGEGYDAVFRDRWDMDLLSTEGFELQRYQ